PVRLSQVSWTHPATSRLLFEGGLSYLYNVGVHRNTTGGALTDRAITDLADGFAYGGRAIDPGKGGLYGTYGYPPYNDNSNWATRVAMSYVTGSHALKFGAATRTGHLQLHNFLPLDESHTFRNRVPVSLTQFVSPFVSKANMKLDLGMYAQDQWTV